MENKSGGSNLLFQLNKLTSSDFFELLFYLVGGFLLLLLPIYNSRLLFDYTQTSKFILLSYFTITLCVITFIRYLWLKKEKKFNISMIDILVVAFVLFCIVNRFFLQDIYGHSLRYYELISLTFLYFILRSLKKNILLPFFLVLVSSAFLESIHGLLQVVNIMEPHHQEFKITGGFFNPAPYAGYLGAILPVAVGVFLHKEILLKGILQKIPLCYYFFLAFCIATVLLILFIIPITRSRAALISSLGSVCYLVFFYPPYYESLKRYFIGSVSKIALITFVTIGVIFFFYKIYSIRTASANGRILIWKVTASMIRDSPLLGQGLDSFKGNYMKYQGNYFRARENQDLHSLGNEAELADDNSFAFNEFLQLVAENGVIGAFFVVLILIKISRIRDKDPNLMIVKASLLSVFIFGMFSYPHAILSIKLLLVVCLANVAVFDKIIFVMDWQFFRKVNFFRDAIRVSLTVLFIVGIIIVSVSLGRLRAAYETWHEANIFYEAGQFEEAIELYRSIDDVFQDNGDFLVYHGKALYMAGFYQKSLSVLSRSKYFKTSYVTELSLGNCYEKLQKNGQAITCYISARQMLPARLYPIYLLAKLYYKLGEFTSARKWAKVALIMTPKVKSNATNLIRKELETIMVEEGG